MGFLTYILVFVSVMAVMLLIQIYTQVKKMSQPERMLIPNQRPLSLDRERYIAEQLQRVSGYQFERAAAFQFGAIEVVVFRQKGTQRFLSFFFHQKISVTAESRFDETTSLETSTTGSTGVFPARPKAYRQSFPDAPIETTWQRHLEGESWLIQKFGIGWSPLPHSYEETLMNSMRLSMQYIRSIPFYPFVVLFRFFFIRPLFNNKTIQQQFP